MSGTQRFRRHFFLAAGVAVLLLYVTAPGVAAAGLPALLDPLSPFFEFPPPQAEIRATPIWVWLLSGSVQIPNLQRSLDLKTDLALERDGVFFDWMARFQVGRWSARLHGNMRDFKGILAVQNVPGRPVGEVRFEYDGLRVGGDLDFFQWNRSRVGVNFDVDLYAPTFSITILEADTVRRARTLTPDWSTTLGAHVVLSSGPTFRGIAGIVEARARWPIRGCNVTDWEIAGGFTFPELQFGVIGLRSGYRRTSLDFSDRQTFNGSLATIEFEMNMAGWFAELVYYY